MATVYSSTGTCGGSSSRQWRIALTYSTSSSDTAVTVSWTATIQMKSAAQYGVYLSCDGKSTTGYITSSSSSWKDVCSVSGSTSYTKTTSARTKTITATGKGQTVSGYGGADGSLSVSASISVPALASYSVTYNANGGSGAPSSQTKWYGTNLTLSSTTPTRTGYSFQGWGTSAGDTSVDYAAGATYTGNAALSLYAIWKANTYTITYNANGGSGAPSSQTKTYGVDLTLSSTVPTRTNYNFLGWSTSATAVTKEYDPGATFATNAVTTLYAVWELAYTLPVITSLKANRCDSDGTLNDFGLYAKVTFNWSVCTIISGISVSSVKVTCNGITTTISASGTSGSVTQIVGEGTLSVESQYAVTATVVDSKEGSTTSSTTLAKAAFTMDFLAGGGGAAFGKPAEKSGLEVNWKSYLYNHAYLSNKKYLMGFDTGGNDLLIAGVNENDSTTFGYGGYNKEIGDTGIFGNVIKVYSKGGNAINTLTGGVGIASNDDLNDYVTVGNYCCASSTAAKTLSNCPYTASGFALKVGNVYNNSMTHSSIYQELITLRGQRYTRHLSAGTWSDWVQTLSEYNTKDYVVAQGTSGNWEYWKFASGLAICSYYGTGTASHYSGPHASWFYGFTGTVAYPFAFTKIPAAAFAVRIGSGFAAHCNTSEDKNYLSWLALSNCSGSNPYALEGIVIGRWK